MNLSVLNLTNYGGHMMNKNTNVQNGTNKKFDQEVGIVAAANSDSKVDVTVYLSERDKYKTEFNSWSKKTAQSTLEMCRVVYEAKKELINQDFLKFCNEIGRKDEDATVRKYLKIGEKYDKFYQYVELLPNSWTSIYQITQLPSEVFEALVATDNSMANMTGNQIKLLKGKKTEDMSNSTPASTASHTIDVPLIAAPTTAQTSTATSEDEDAESIKTEAFLTAITSSDAKLTDSFESSTESASVTVDATNDESSSDPDRQFAQQATNTMLEKISVMSSNSVPAHPTPIKATYEVLVRFKTIPIDDTWFDLVEQIEILVDKLNFDVEIIETRPAYSE